MPVDLRHTTPAQLQPGAGQANSKQITHTAMRFPSRVQCVAPNERLIAIPRRLLYYMFSLSKYIAKKEGTIKNAVCLMIYKNTNILLNA